MKSETWENNKVSNQLDKEAAAVKVKEVLKVFTEDELDYLNGIVEWFQPTLKGDWFRRFQADIDAVVEDRFLSDKNVIVGRCYQAMIAMSDEDYELIMNNPWP